MPEFVISVPSDVANFAVSRQKGKTIEEALTELLIFGAVKSGMRQNQGLKS